MIQFKERFNYILKHNHYNQTDMAEYLGVDKSTVSDYKKGKALPSLTVFYKLCQYLDESADYLLGLSDN